MSVVRVMARTADGYETTIDVVDLDEKSWREFVVRRLVAADVLTPSESVVPRVTPYTTDMTRDQLYIREQRRKEAGE